ncbi:MAG TPA: erythromycin esterase family protein, partial [Gemmatimonadales bacterium]|nr:erythromycin esterase family protein [Gemmatimonadales bacterium]
MTLASPWQGQVNPRDRVCLSLHLEAGHFARLLVEAPNDLEALDVTILAPGDSTPVVRVGVGTVPSRRVAWEASSTGHYTIQLVGTRRPRAAAVSVTHLEDPAALSARQATAAADPRVTSLAQRVIPFRTLDPSDSSFADLEPLKSLLGTTRVVLLGEADHGDGTDFLAKSRLIRFLHAELGFDVLAFEAGVYDMWRAWREISAGRDPMASFTRGAFWMWAQARQVEPLVNYVAAAARGPRPLVLAGVDVLRTGRTTPADTLLAELRAFLEATGAGGPFTDPESPETRALRRLHDMQRPDSTTLLAFRAAAAVTADRLDRPGAASDARYWARILRNAAIRAGG